MRFHLDHDVDARVAKVLRDAGHQCWTASEAGLATASDDTQSVHADNRGAAVITHDKEFTERRWVNAIGQHIWLGCDHPDGPALIERSLEEIVLILEREPHITLRVRPNGIERSRSWL